MTLPARLLLPPLATNAALGAYLLLAWAPQHAADPASTFPELWPVMLVWLLTLAFATWAGMAWLRHLMRRLAHIARGEGRLANPRRFGSEFAHCAAQLEALHDQLRESQVEQERLSNLLRQSEERLHESEERYVIAMRGASDGAMEWDIASGRSSYSPRWLSMLGLDAAAADEGIAAWYGRIHADDYAQTHAAVQRLLDGRTTLFENEHRLRHGSGEYLWVAARGVVIRSASGKATKFIGSLTDITEKKLTQQLLGQIEEGLDVVSGKEFFHLLVQNMARAFGARHAFITECLEGPDGKPDRVRTIAFWSGEGFVENIEYDLAGTPCQEVIAGNTTCFYPMGLWQHYPEDAGLESYIGIAVPGPGGRVVGHLACLDPAPMRSNLPVAAVQRLFAARASGEIIRMKLEESLHVSQQTNQFVCDSVSEVVLQFGPNGRIEAANPAARMLCGLPPEAVQGLPAERLLASPGARITLEELLGSLGNNRARSYCLSDRQGQPHEIRGIVRPIHDRERKLARIVLVGTPVVARKHHG